VILLPVKDILSNYEAENMELSLEFTPNAKESKLFNGATDDIMTSFSKSNLTTNWHHYGVNPNDFNKYLAPNGMKSLSINKDGNNLVFISTMEHESAPIYATQWHPEANSYDRDHVTVNHSKEAIYTMQYLSNFFVNEARMKGIGPGDIDKNIMLPMDAYPLLFANSDLTDNFSNYMFY
jgi:gamma-glutamyl hydrolase